MATRYLMRNAFTVVITALAVASTNLPAQTITAYKTGERTTGQTKQCYYDGLGSEYCWATREIDPLAT